MFLVSIAVLSIIIGLIRKGSFANILSSDIKASFLFIISLLLFITVRVGNAAGIALITDWTYFLLLGGYILLLLGIILNLNIWMFILLFGTVSNFVVTFINGGKMPISLTALQTAGLTAASIEESAIYALSSATTNFPFLGGIIPLPLPSIFAEVLSPGTILIAIGIFGVIQNVLLGVTYEYDDEYEDEFEDSGRDFMFDEDSEQDEDFGRDYTVGDININELEDSTDDDDDDVDESLFSRELPDLDPNVAQDDFADEDQSNSNTEILNELFNERDAELTEESSLVEEIVIEEEDEETDTTEILNELEQMSESLEADTFSVEEEELTDTSKTDDEAFEEVFGVDEDEAEISESNDYLFDTEEDDEEDEAYYFDEEDEIDSEEDEDAQGYFDTDDYVEDEDDEEDSEYDAYEDDETEDAYQNTDAYDYEYDNEVEEDIDQIDSLESEYATKNNDELTLSTDALQEAREVIEKDLSEEKERLDFNKNVQNDQPLNVDTESPFIIVNGRIVENPYYKFKKGSRNDLPEDNTQMGTGVYVMQSRQPNNSGKPSFSPPRKNNVPPNKNTNITETEATDSGYEKVEMKIGDVQIKFWKKDKDSDS